MTLHNAQIESALIELIQDEFLDGEDEVTPATPLLEWGVLKSIELTRLVAFIKEEFGVTVPADQVVAEHMKDVASISSLVESLRAGVGANAS